MWHKQVLSKAIIILFVIIIKAGSNYLYMWCSYDDIKTILHLFRKSDKVNIKRDILYNKKRMNY